MVASILVLGLIGTGAAYVLNYQIISSESATIAAAVTYLLPVVAIILGIIVLNESITVLIVVGIVVLIGVVVTRTSDTSFLFHLSYMAGALRICPVALGALPGQPLGLPYRVTTVDDLVQVGGKEAHQQYLRPDEYNLDRTTPGLCLELIIIVQDFLVDVVLVLSGQE